MTVFLGLEYLLLLWKASTTLLPLRVNPQSQSVSAGRITRAHWGVGAVSAHCAGAAQSPSRSDNGICWTNSSTYFEKGLFSRHNPSHWGFLCSRRKTFKNVACPRELYRDHWISFLGGIPTCDFGFPPRNITILDARWDSSLPVPWILGTGFIIMVTLHCLPLH